MAPAAAVDGIIPAAIQVSAGTAVVTSAGLRPPEEARSLGLRMEVAAVAARDLVLAVAITPTAAAAAVGTAAVRPTVVARGPEPVARDTSEVSRTASTRQVGN